MDKKYVSKYSHIEDKPHISRYQFMSLTWGPVWQQHLPTLPCLTSPGLDDPCVCSPKWSCFTWHLDLDTGIVTHNHPINLQCSEILNVAHQHQSHLLSALCMPPFPCVSKTTSKSAFQPKISFCTTTSMSCNACLPPNSLPVSYLPCTSLTP